MNLVNPISTKPRKKAEMSTVMITTQVEPITSFFVGNTTFLSSSFTSCKKSTILLNMRWPFLDKENWQARRDSNPQQPDLESGALPIRATGLCPIFTLLFPYARYVCDRTCSIFQGSTCQVYSSCSWSLNNFCACTHCRLGERFPALFIASHSISDFGLQIADFFSFHFAFRNDFIRSLR